MIQEVVDAMTYILLAKFILNDIPHAMTGGGGSSSEVSAIIARTGMKEYEYRYFPEPEEEPKHRVYPYTRTRVIGPYEIKMTRTDSACMVKLYEYLEGWKKKLRATWSGLDVGECVNKFEQIASTTRQVRAEQKSALRR